MINFDFTLKIYNLLLSEFINSEYTFRTFASLFDKHKIDKKCVILRHDVDKKPDNSLIKAKLEAEYNIQSTYYFRIVKKSYNQDIIKEIAKLGHEIGYHYEDLSRANGNYDKAILSFEKNLDLLRKFYPVKTICMHGSPLSKWDNRNLWQHYNYRDYGIIGEPYFDINYEEFYYLTDTGRRWDGEKYSIRDKVKIDTIQKYKTTFDLINAIQDNLFPNKVMITTHPQRWSNKYIFWMYELTTQNFKNIFKNLLIKFTRD